MCVNKEDHQIYKLVSIMSDRVIGVVDIRVYYYTNTSEQNFEQILFVHDVTNIDISFLP